MNLIQKFHALLVSDKVNVWHFPKKPTGCTFYFWLLNEPENKDGYGFFTMDRMIEEAYRRIDPLLQPLPADCPMSDQEKSKDFS
jgi:hypothetical protein